MIDRIKINKSQNRKSILQKIIIGVLTFIIGFQISWISFIPFSESYKMTEKYILENNFLKQDIGEIKSIQIVPIGNVKTEKNLNGEKTSAKLKLIVKGENKYLDLKTSALKTSENDNWEINIDGY